MFKIPDGPNGAPRVSIDLNPIQVPGRPERITTVVYGGPAAKRDVRMTFDREVLEKLLALAKDSLSGQVVLNNVGLQIDLWRGAGGHVFETWVIQSSQPEAARSPIEVGHKHSMFK